MKLDIHQPIYRKLESFKSSNRIPNIIFHGPNGGGKHTIVNNFITQLYNNDAKLLKDYVMITNCAQGKGIKFVREDLKFFAKKNIGRTFESDKHNPYFKTIVMTNADKLTVDAQSALRRCIEQFNKTTRFIIIVEDKYKLLKHIVSRFCDIYVPLPILNNSVPENLHIYTQNNFIDLTKYNANRYRLLHRHLARADKKDQNTLCELANSLHQKGFSGIDLMAYIKNNADMDRLYKYELLLWLNKIKSEFRSESLFMFYVLNYIFVRSDINLENLLFM